MSAPIGWLLAGTAPSDYGVDMETASDGRWAVLRAHRPSKGFGTLMQVIAADDYRGQRVRLAASIATMGVDGWCGLWMRVDGTGGQVLAVDNMRDRAIAGTREATPQQVVLDVPPEAARLSFGLLLEGTGSAHLANVTLAVVGPDVPTTAPPLPGLPRAPRNLDFTEE